tara:strand:+ start:385 stop:855 length:471 start_codon:yes stop_codon:yes gene_type:complete
MDRIYTSKSIIELAELASDSDSGNRAHVVNELKFRKTLKAHKLAEALTAAGCPAKAKGERPERNAAKPAKAAKAPKAKGPKKPRSAAQKAATKRMLEGKARSEARNAKAQAAAFPADAMSSGGDVGDFADIAHSVKSRKAQPSMAARLVSFVSALG